MMFSLHLHILLQLVFQVRKIISVCYFFFQKSSFYLLFYFIYLYLSMMGFFLVSPSVYLASQLSTVSDIIFGPQAVGFLEDFA